MALKNNNPIPRATSRILTGTKPAVLRKIKYSIIPTAKPKAVLYTAKVFSVKP